MYILSNQHIFFPTINGAKTPAGTLIYESGEINIRRPVARTSITKAEPNPWPIAQVNDILGTIGDYHDSALAEVLVPWTTDINGIGSPTGIAEPKVGMRVKKSSYTTGVQKGVVTLAGLDTNTVPLNGKSLVQKNIFDCNTRSAPGDSGSVILTDPDNKLIGLQFGAPEKIGNHTLCCRIQPILAAYGVSVVTSTSPNIPVTGQPGAISPLPSTPTTGGIPARPGFDELINAIFDNTIDIGGNKIPTWMIGTGGLLGVMALAAVAASSQK